ncbi:MAG: hypothetical protein AAB589_01730 [Patescibacteria group bacterium]
MKIKFYVALCDLLQDEVFVEDSARQLIELHQSLKPHISLEIDRVYEGEDASITIEFLRESHYNYGFNLEMEGCYRPMQDFAASAFKDLAKHMRNPEAREVFQRLYNLRCEDASSDLCDLYLCQTNVRHLGKRGDRVSVVTIVVSDYQSFVDQLECGRWTTPIHYV